MGIFGLGRQPGQPRYNGSVANLSITESVYATTLPILFGTKRLHGKLLDYFNFKGVKTTAPTGKGIFGSKGDYYEYYATVVIALAQGPCVALLNVWTYNGMLENLSSTYNYTVPGGGGWVSPIDGNAAPIQVDLGVVHPQAYSVATNDFGGSPKVLTGIQNVPLRRVPSLPGAGQYSFDLATGTYTFGAAMAGATVAISYSSTFSLYYLIQTQFDLIPASSPWQITVDNYQYFYQDSGVTFIDNNSPGIPVGGAPTSPNEYQVVSTGGSFPTTYYQFYSGDAGRPVAIKYSYTSSDPNITSSSALNLTFFNGAQSQAPWSYIESANPSHAFGYTGVCYVASENLDLGQTAQMPPYNYEVAGQAIYPGQQDALLTDVIALLLCDPLCGIDFPLDALDMAGTWANYAIPHWLANGFFISDCLEAAEGIADKLGKYCDAGNTAAFFSGGLLKLVPYSEVSAVGNGAVYTPLTNTAITLTWDNVLLPSNQNPGASLSDDFITVDRKASVDLYNYVQANYSQRINSYNNNLINQQSDANIALCKRRMESAQDWTFICLDSAAQWALSCRLNRGIYIDKTYKLSLPYTFDYLEPMDMLITPTGIPVRIQKIEEDENQILAIEAENFLYGGSSASIYPVQSPNRYQPTQSAADPGSTYPAFVQNTSQQTGGVLYTLTVAAAGDNLNWGGCQIWVSIDGVNYSLAGTINEICSLGILSAALPLVSDPDATAASLTAAGSSGYLTASGVPTTTSGAGIGLLLNLTAVAGVVTSGSVDSSSPGAGYALGDQVYPTQAGASGDCYFTITQIGNILSVDMSPSNAPLVGASQSVADQFGTLCAIISPDGLTCEFLSYENCELTAANRYNLSYLRRGVDGSAPASFPAGSNFVYIGSVTLFQYQYKANNVGQPLYIKLPSFNLTGQAIQPLSQCKAYELFLTSQGTAPLGPKYSPSAWADSGMEATANPTGAYDGDVTTPAVGTAISNNHLPVVDTDICTWSGFPSVVTDGTQKLYISYEMDLSITTPGNGTVKISPSIGNSIALGFSSKASGTATIAIPSGTDISTITVQAESHAISGLDGYTQAQFSIFEIWIQ